MKTPSWLRASPDEIDELPPLPPVATLPPAVPEFSTHDEESMLVQRAAALHAQLKRSIETAQVELAESVLGRQGDQQKIAFLEKENGELRLEIAQKANNIQTLQSQIEEYRHFMNVWKDGHVKVGQVFDRFGVKGTPKKERKPRPKKERKAAAPAAETVG